MLSRYAALVKNMRGLVLFNPVEDVAKDLKWLTERFKYRVLGVPPSLVGRISKLAKPLVPLTHPHRELVDFVKFLSESLGLDYEVVEAACLASCYVSPILALGSRAQESLKLISVGEVSTRVRMSLSDWKLHLRIADYSVLDLYSWSTSQAERLWELEVDLNTVISERVEAVKRDERRYWRLQGGNVDARTFLVYLDLVQALCKYPSILSALRSYDRNVVSACLAINVAVFIRPD